MTDPPPLPEPLAQQLATLGQQRLLAHWGQLEPAARDRLGQQLAGIDWRQVAAMRRLAADDNTAAALPVDAAWLTAARTACRPTAASRRPEPSGPAYARCGCRSGRPCSPEAVPAPARGRRPGNPAAVSKPQRHLPRRSGFTGKPVRTAARAGAEIATRSGRPIPWRS